VCEICNERSYVRAPKLCNDTIKIADAEKPPDALTSEKCADAKEPETESPASVVKKSVTFSSDVPMLIYVQEPEQEPETKEYDKPINAKESKTSGRVNDASSKSTQSAASPARSTSTALVAVKPVDARNASPLSDNHVCYRDADSLFCLICQKLMFFVFANNLEYPYGFPTLLLDKVKLLEKTLTVDAYAQIVEKLNGGSITGATAHVLFSTCGGDVPIAEFENADTPMKIEITTAYNDTVYSGPGKDALAEIFAAAIARERTIIIPVVITNSDIDDQSDMFIAIYPNGNVYCLDPTMSPASETSCVENLLACIFTGIKSNGHSARSTSIRCSEAASLGFIAHSFWNKTCVRQSPVYINFTESPMWKPLMMLVLMSLLSIGYQVKDAIAFLVEQDKQTMSLLLDAAVERIIASMTL
jgi:hypothetical protein